MKTDAFLEELLQVMERKTHWAWPAFGSGLVPKRLLHVHFEQEYEVYIRDFPIFLGRALVQCPVAEVRQELAENLYEEETGGLVAGRPHPELFMEYPKGLGFDLSRYEAIELLPEAKDYRAYLDETTTDHGWEVASAISTIFVEGTNYERGEVDEKAPKRPVKPLSQHPLVLHYGLAEEHLALTKAHREVEGEHRGSAWHILLNHVPQDAYRRVIDAMDETCRLWRHYRDGVAKACGLVQDQDGRPALADEQGTPP
ncbi:MAG: iron-containing redox enzyme family protein [Myxococcota bacterium]|nr:iron-containing redox enzyme family protein [Myxococcota bacterium]